MKSIKIRKAKEKDVKDIIKVIQESVLATHVGIYPEEDIQETLNNYTNEKVIKYIKESNYFVAVHNELIVGCVLVKENKMRSLYVLPRFMGKGIGRKLVEVAEECVKENGFDYIYLWSSLVSHEFYLHMGYRDVKGIENKDGLILHMGMRKDF
jgi:N-acetylglutamate synthase-like GNAT family acetyltransferase